MSDFEKLPKGWRDGIDEAIDDVDGGEHPEVAVAFRQAEAETLSKCDIAKKPTKREIRDEGEQYVWYLEGWNAAVEKLSKGPIARSLIASWVRAHGEATTYCPDFEPEYEAFIVKESDVNALEGKTDGK